MGPQFFRELWGTIRLRCGQTASRFVFGITGDSCIREILCVRQPCEGLRLAVDRLTPHQSILPVCFRFDWRYGITYHMQVKGCQ